MILRPVSPASAWGPPRTKLPVGLMWYSTMPASRNFAGITGRITRALIVSSICSGFTSPSCWALTTTVVTRWGRNSSSYSKVTCALPSGRSHGISPDRRASESRRTSLWAYETGAGIDSGVSSQA